MYSDICHAQISITHQATVQKPNNHRVPIIILLHSLSLVIPAQKPVWEEPEEKFLHQCIPPAHA